MVFYKLSSTILGRAGVSQVQVVGQGLDKEFQGFMELDFQPYLTQGGLGQVSHQ